MEKQLLLFGKAFGFDEKHAIQVTKLALCLFDCLRPLHNLSDRQRAYLKAAGLLHDIGWCEGGKGHHKVSRDKIIAASLPFDATEKIIIGLIARYHRKALPSQKHEYFKDLDKDVQTVVTRLSSLLRIADGLDRSHEAYVEGLHCEVTEEHVVIVLEGRNLSAFEVEAAKMKADLFAQVFGKEIVFKF